MAEETTKPTEIINYYDTDFFKNHKMNGGDGDTMMYIGAVTEHIPIFREERVKLMIKKNDGIFNKIFIEDIKTASLIYNHFKKEQQEEALSNKEEDFEFTEVKHICIEDPSPRDNKSPLHVTITCHRSKQQQKSKL